MYLALGCNVWSVYASQGRLVWGLLFFSCLVTDSGRLALGVFLNLRAETVLSSSISSSSFLDVSLKMQLLAAGLEDVVVIFNSMSPLHLQ